MAKHPSFPNLISLGFAFYGEPSVKPADPEKTIIELLPVFYTDRKIFRMLLRWLMMVSDLIHIERLLALAKDAAPENKVVLAVVAMKLESSCDKRWHLIHRHMKKQLGKKTVHCPVPPEYADPYLLNKHGVDPDFEKWGIQTSLVMPEDEKKITPLPEILKRHLWLRLRALIGSNFRADLIYLLTTKAVSNPNQAAKHLSCSRETSYRLWHLLALAGISNGRLSDLDFKFP